MPVLPSPTNPTTSPYAVGRNAPDIITALDRLAAWHVDQGRPFSTGDLLIYVPDTLPRDAGKVAMWLNSFRQDRFPHPQYVSHYDGRRQTWIFAPSLSEAMVHDCITDPIPPRKLIEGVEAYVRPDNRVCVPAGAFVAYAKALGRTIDAGPNGTPLYVSTSGNTVTVSVNPPGSAYHLWANRGRLAFVNPPDCSFRVGSRYSVYVSARGIEISST